MAKKAFQSQIKGAGYLLWAVVLIAALNGRASWGCACGCGIFEVGTSSMFPNGSGGMAFLEYDFMDQHQNWSGTSSASADSNSDKEIRTHFITVGAQYMFNREHGLQLEIPFRGSLLPNHRWQRQHRFG